MTQNKKNMPIDLFSQIKRCKATTFIYTIISILLIISVSFVVYELFFNLTRSDKIIIIDRGNSISRVGEILEESSLIRSRYIFNLASHIGTRVGYTLKAGEYKIEKGSCVVDIFNQISLGRIIHRHVTIPEGYTVHQIINTLLRADKLSHSGFKTTQRTLHDFPEGSLMPDTYSYVADTNILDILYSMREKMMNFLEIEWAKRDKSIDGIIKSIDEALVLASIIEKEAFFRDEGPKIASVYINRLRIGMPLQACPTVIYSITKGAIVLNRKLKYSDLKYNSEHNTYIRSGLPPTAICNPGKEAILSVLHPMKTKFLYFIANESKRHTFSYTYSNHIKKANELRAIKEKEQGMKYTKSNDNIEANIASQPNTVVGAN